MTSKKTYNVQVLDASPESFHHLHSLFITVWVRVEVTVVAAEKHKYHGKLPIHMDIHNVRQMTDSVTSHRSFSLFVQSDPPRKRQGRQHFWCVHPAKTRHSMNRRSLTENLPVFHSFLKHLSDNEHRAQLKLLQHIK